MYINICWIHWLVHPLIFDTGLLVPLFTICNFTWLVWCHSVSHCVTKLWHLQEAFSKCGIPAGVKIDSVVKKKCTSRVIWAANKVVRISETGRPKLNCQFGVNPGIFAVLFSLVFSKTMLYMSVISSLLCSFFFFSDWEDRRSFVVQRPSFLETFCQHGRRDHPPPDHVGRGGAEDHTAGKTKSLSHNYCCTLAWAHPKSTYIFFLSSVSTTSHASSRAPQAMFCLVPLYLRDGRHLYNRCELQLALKQ